MNNYNTIEDIQAQHQQARKLANKRKTLCKVLWAQLIAKEEPNRFMTPTQRLLSNADKAAAIFDGVMFGTKVYRMFRGGKEKKKKSFLSRIINIF